MIRVEDLPPEHPGRRLLTKRTPFFAAPNEPRCSYCAYIPTSWTPEAELPVLVAVHGTGRSVGELREGLIPFAEQHQVIVVIPLFPVGIDDPDGVHDYKVVDAHGIRFDVVLLDILEQVRVRWNACVGKVLLCGHSGGGQFAHRFLYLHPDRVIAAAIGAPGGVTLLDDSLAWPEGIADTRQRFGITVDPAAIARIPVLLIIGGDDDGRADLAAMGDHGHSRPEQLNRLAETLARHGTAVQKIVVPGVGHSAAGTRPPIIEFFTGLLPG
ncbi:MULTISPECIES: alpha/beta hydrolase [unclassified Amycolatopsis]|uniref:alpha/beta hydrolase n=1 Tax=unclassified Amycolatopsis TaxID=2618356 RepID=UPI002874FFB2|nr:MULTISPECIES: alpha/beta hydrolase [unclassified Amycolatopsis]MDS0139944.1 alpha/beta hydrolase [Amycolatopsis sp. 505]MDS0148144.1 alpha/beta hydrolase [Amycolatopsis sp. CM201R]